MNRFIQSTRLASVQPPVIPILHDLMKDNPNTISLGQGVVYYPPPPEIEEELHGFYDIPGNHRYGPVSGLLSLRQHLQTKLARENAIETGNEQQLIVSAGGNMAFFNALLAIADPGDEIILISPYYFNHRMAVTMANCQPVTVPTDNNFQLDLNAISDAINYKTRAVVSVSPNNPTGAVYPENDLQTLNKLCSERGIFHIHDEAYEYFTYEGRKHFSPASLTESKDHTISLFSLSKSYGFASWRIGYMTVPNALYEAVAKIQDTILISPPVVSQKAALAAIKIGRDYCLKYRTKIEEVRTVLLTALATLDECCEPVLADGAFYVLLRLRKQEDPMTIVQKLITKYRVAILPGSAFGLAGCSLRISYGALPPVDAANGFDRLISGLKALI